MGGLRTAQSKGPPRWALVALLALFTLPPFLARALGSPIGDFAMFSRIGRYHLELSIVTAEVETEVPVRELKPHLSRDARLIILPAASNGFGQDQTDLLEAGLPDIGRLLCQLRPEASSAKVRLGRGPIEIRTFAWTESITVCRHSP
jgi:hypothetical protein